MTKYPQVLINVETNGKLDLENHENLNQALSIIKGSPKAAPPKPSPVLTKPDQEKIKATSPNSNAVKLMFSSGNSYIVLIKTILY